jgi:formylglycine-generating enzyme required for sulfatase activity
MLGSVIGDLGQLALTLRAQPPKAEPQTSPPTPAPLVESALGKPFDPAEIFRQAGEAQRVGEYETALRLLNTLRLDVPDYLPNYVSIQVVDIERALKEQAQHKEYLRVYEQIGLLAQGEKTLDAARQLWLELRRDYTGIGEDPENLAALLYPPIDDVLPPPFEWLEIPAGLVKLEGSGDSYIPHGKSEAFLGQGFVIAKYPITNSQFQFFVEAGDGYRNTHWWDYSDEAEVWRSFHTQPKEPEWGGPYDHPRVNLAWFDAVAFCRWLSSRSGVMVRLPTEQEWQRAAQGDDGRRYPWGNQEPNAELANFDNQVGKTTPVGSYPKGASPYGALDMAGNVWEWCSTDYQTGLHNIGQAAVYRVVRGGSWGVKPFSIRTARRSRGEPSSEGSSRGFRCACSF